MSQVIATSNIQSIKAAVAEEMARGLMESADAIEDDIVKGMFKSRGGRRYRRPAGGTYYTHEASQPGNPPAVDTEKLVKSVGSKRRSATEVEVGMRDKKAPWLEFGTEHIEPRPSLGPAVAREGKRFAARLAARLTRIR